MKKIFAFILIALVGLGALGAFLLPAAPQDGSNSANAALTGPVEVVYAKAAASDVSYDLKVSDYETKLAALSPDQKQLAPQSKEALVMEYQTGEILFEHNSQAARPIASMIKIMTLNCIYDTIKEGKIGLDDQVQVSKRAASMGGSQAFLDAGSTHSAENLIKTIIICSANDSCVAMAEHISGSVEGFVELMNQKAKDYSLVNTHFENCTGLPVAGQFSCAHDVAVMMRQLINNENFFKHSKIWMDDYKHPDGRVTGLTNTNKLVRFYEGCDGGKTGFTQEAMHCLCATAKRGETRFISVVIGAPSSATRFAESSNMLNYAFANFESKVYLEANQSMGELKVRGGKMPVMQVVPAQKLVAFGQKGKVNGTVEVEMSAKLQAPVKKGDVVGKAVVKTGENIIASVDLVAVADVPARTFGDSFKEIVRSW